VPGHGGVLPARKTPRLNDDGRRHFTGQVRSRCYIREAGWDHRPTCPTQGGRCESCYLVHPNRDARGEWGGPDACSACGGTRLSGRVYFRSGAFSMDGGITLIEADAWTRK
jgi:hypothetical protein